MSEHWDRIIEQGRLLTLPEVYLRLQQVLARDDFSMQEVTEVIQYDPAITTRLLKLVKSAYLGLGPRIDTISHAVNYLGAQSIHDLVLTTVLADRLGDIRNEHFNLQDFWLRSVRSALMTRELAARSLPQEAERLFVVGLIHDLGYLMMQQVIPREMAAVPNSGDLEGRLARERERLGFDSQDVTQELFTQWQLPEILGRILAHRSNPQADEEVARQSALLALGCRLAGEQPDTDEQTPLPALDPQLLALAQLQEEDLLEARRGADEELGSAMRLLFPHLID